MATSSDSEAPSPLAKFSSGTRALLEDTARSPTYAKLLEQRELQLGREIIAIRIHRNTLVAINHLPVEVLCDVFAHLAHTVEFEWPGRRIPSWTRVTHVCKYWRAVSVNYPPLWSTFRRFCRPEMMKLMLARSKDAPLTIEISNYHRMSPGYTDAIRGVFAQTHRLHSISLGPDYPLAFALPLSAMLADATGPAPLLKTLILKFDKQKSQPLPPDFLLGGALALEKLEVSSVDVPWDKLPLPDVLRCLHLKEAATRPLPLEFFKSLCRLTILQDLTLIGYLPDAGSPLPLPLPALTKLSVTDSWDRISDFLDAIQVPGIRHVDVSLCDLTFPGGAAEACVRKLKSNVQETLEGIPGLSQLTMRDIGGDFADRPTFEMEWYPECIPKVGDSTELPDLRITLSFEAGSITPREALGSINNHFGLSTMSNLLIDTTTAFDATMVVDTLAKLPNVKKLTLISSAILPLLRLMERDPSLAQKKKRGKRAGVIPPYFPALRSLDLLNIDFEESTRDYAIVDLLVEVVKKRPKLYKIKYLDMQGCRNFSTRTHLYLQMALSATTVKWDGHEEWSSDDDSDDFSSSDGWLRPESPDYPIMF